MFVHDRNSKTSVCASVSSSGEPGNVHSITKGGPCLSADGRFVAFSSQATNLVANDTNQRADIFVRDLLEQRTVRVSVASDGAQSDSNSWSVSLSADGRRVAFESDATTLTPDDTNGDAHVFVHEIDWSEVRSR